MPNFKIITITGENPLRKKIVKPEKSFDEELEEFGKKQEANLG